MPKKVYALKFNRTSTHTQSTVMVFDIEYKPILYKGSDDIVIKHIVDSIMHCFGDVLSEFNITRNLIESKLVCNKWQTFYFKNNTLGCEGVLKLDPITLY